MLTKEITNQREYRSARAEADRLEAQMAKQDREPDNAPPQLRQAMHGATQSRLDELRHRIAWYEALQRSGGATIEAQSLEDVPSILIQARVAADLTQKQLAARLGVSEQQVQRDEKTRYAGSSLDRLIAVARALNVSFQLTAVLPRPQAASSPHAAETAEDGLSAS